MESTHFYAQYTQKASYSDDKGVAEQGNLTIKLMSKPQKLYGIDLEQNVDQTLQQLNSKYCSCCC